MQLLELTRDECSGSFDIPSGWETCDGSCGEVYPERDLVQVGDRLYCADCEPEVYE